MPIPAACGDSGGSQVTLAITTRGTRDEELDLVKVSPIREAEQEKGTPFPNKYLKCRTLEKQLHDLEEYLEPKDKISTA